ncbi:Nn.00g069530.m01.CDS01 [Neocucurbitaria sp. VM-36]
MVLRKPEEQDGLVPAPLSKANPPYPTTPAEEHPPALPSSSDGAVYSPDLDKSPAFKFKPLDEAKGQKDKLDDDSDFSEDEWNQSDDDFEDVDPHDVPDALKPAGGKPMPSANISSGLPDILRAGPPAGVPIKRSIENISPMPTGASSASYGAASNTSEQSNGSIPLQTNNPYLKMQTTGQSNWGGESSQAIWGDAPGHTEKYEPVELPASQTPITPSHEMNNLKLDDNVSHEKRSQSIDQPPLIAVNSPSPQSEHPRGSIVSNPWEPGTDVSSLDAASRGHGLPEGNIQSGGQRTWQEQQDWERSEREARQKEAHAAHEAATKAEQERKYEDEFNRLEQQPPVPQFAPPPVPSEPEEHPPALPPRRSQEETPPTMPPRPLDTRVGPASTTAPESPNTAMNRQRKEHYQIKHIRWYDYNKKGIRTSPILTQNLNGPCPLLALVNALVLSTPAGLETALVETLRTRETVSLGLLLDAVFDELMSGRRGDAAQALPDVSELYKFLLALHTGLNVNPMFVNDRDTASGNTSLTNRGGGFENTQDMNLYRTFDIPLMHGWLPEAGSEAYTAFDRVAKSYETSQYVQFQEEELDAKLRSGEPLNADEQQMFTDIQAIKEFLSRWPTQLTEHGLKVMRDTLQDGQVAILFRNDHFSTLCKDPRTGQLVTLVTDQGYSTHDEIVWESLTDVNGQGSQLFSGDFRSVDNSNAPVRPQGQQQAQSGDGHGWTTVQSGRGNHRQQTSSQDAEPTSPGGLSRAEQEDHDLALALQLQEEEEDRQRREAEQRERENRLSMNAIAAHSQPRPAPGPGPNPNRRASREQAPVIPPRRNNITTHRPNNDPAPPPTYEEASTSPRYNPPPGHPANPQAPLPPQGSAYQSNSGGLPPPPGAGPAGRRPLGRPMQAPNPNMPGGRPGRRQSAGQGVVGPGGSEEREKCVVM